MYAATPNKKCKTQHSKILEIEGFSEWSDTKHEKYKQMSQPPQNVQPAHDEQS